MPPVIPATPVYPDVELLLVAWFRAQFPGHMVRTVLPGGGDGVSPYVPLIRLVRVGGTDPQLTIDRPLVDIEAFAVDRGEAFALAGRIRNALEVRLPGTRFNGGNFQTVRTVSGPTHRPWDDTKVQRVGASYETPLHIT